MSMPEQPRVFAPGRTYGVLRMTDEASFVVVQSRTTSSLTLGDGRVCRILPGVAPDGGDEEVIRLGEVGAFAAGGVVRACHLQPYDFLVQMEAK